MTGQTEEYSSKEDPKSKAQRTNIFNTNAPYSSACRCSGTNNTILNNNITNQQRCVDGTCVNIIVNSDIEAEHRIKETQIAKVPLDRESTNADAVYIGNTNNPEENRTTLEPLSTIPQTIQLTGNTILNTGQMKSNLTPSHESTKNYSKTSTFKNDASDESNKRLIPKKTVTTKTNDKLGRLSTEYLMQTRSKEVPSTHNVKKIQNEASHGKLSEKTTSINHNLQVNDNESKDVPSFASTSEKLSARNSDAKLFKTQHSDTGFSYGSSLTGEYLNLSGTRESHTNLPRIPSPFTNAVSLPSLVSVNTPISIIDANVIPQTSEKTPKISYTQNKTSKLCFCNGPDLTPCGTEKLLTKEEISKVPFNERLDDTCICDRPEVQRKVNVHRTDNLGRATGEVTNNDKCITQTNCMRKTDNDTCDYSTSRNRKGINEDVERTDEIESVDNLSSGKSSRKQKIREIETRDGLHDNELNIENIAGKSSLSPKRTADGVERHDTKEIKSQPVKTKTDGILRKDVKKDAKQLPINQVNDKRDNVTACDLTRPEFVQMLTEIKEQTCNLERQLAAMNSNLKGKQIITGSAINAILGENKIDSPQGRNIEGTNVANTCTTNSCKSFHIRQNIKHYEPPRREEKPIYTSPATSSNTNTPVNKPIPIITLTPAQPAVTREEVEANLNVSCCTEPTYNLAPLVINKRSNELICRETKVPDNACGSTIVTEQPNKSISSQVPSIDSQVKERQIHCVKKAAIQMSTVSVPENIVNINESSSKRKFKRPKSKTTSKNQGCSSIFFENKPASEKLRKKDNSDVSCNPSKIVSNQSQEGSIQNKSKSVAFAESYVSQSSPITQSTPKKLTPTYHSNINNVERQGSSPSASIDCQSSNSCIEAATLTSADFQPVFTSSKLYEEGSPQSDKKLTLTSKASDTTDSSPVPVMIESIYLEFDERTPTIFQGNMTPSSNTNDVYPADSDMSKTQYKDLPNLVNQKPKEIKGSDTSKSQISSSCNNKCSVQKDPSNACSLRPDDQIVRNTEHLDLSKDTDNHRDQPRSFFGSKEPKSVSEVETETKSHEQSAKVKSRIPTLRNILRITHTNEQHDSQSSEQKIIKHDTSVRQSSLEQPTKLSVRCLSGAQDTERTTINDQQNTQFSNLCHNTFNSEKELISTNYEICDKYKQKGK